MKITFLIGSDEVSGGLGVIYDVSKALVEKGHIVTHVVSRSIYDVYNSCEGVDFICIADKKSPQNFRHRCIYFYKQIFSIPKDTNILIATFYPTALIAYFWGLWRRKAKVIYFVQGYEPDFCTPPFKEFKAFVARLSYLVSKNMITNSKWLGDKISKSSTHVIPLGINLDIFKASSHNSPVLTFSVIARSQPIKGWSFFINVIEKAQKDKSFPKFFLKIMTPEKSVPLPKVENFEVIHPRSLDEVAEVYRQSDIFLNTSISEGFCLPPLEAMACGAAVICTDSGGVSEYAENELNAIVVGDYDVRVFYESLKNLIKSPDKVRFIRKNGLKTAEKFSRKGYLTNVLDYILEPEL